MYMLHIKFQDSSISGSRVPQLPKELRTDRRTDRREDGRIGPNQYAPSTSSKLGHKKEVDRGRDGKTISKLTGKDFASSTGVFG